MQRDFQDADAPAGVLDHGQDVSLGAIEEVGCEEVARSYPQPGQFAVDPAVAPAGGFRGAAGGPGP